MSYGIALGTWRITTTYRSGSMRFGGIEYSEHGAGDFSLNAQTTDLHSEYSGSSLEIAKEFGFENGSTLTPSIGMSKTTITGLDVETSLGIRRRSVFLQNNADDAGLVFRL